MKKQIAVICLSSLMAVFGSCGFASAPVEEAHEYVPIVQKPAAVAGSVDTDGTADGSAPVEEAGKSQGQGFSLSSLPRTTWQDSSQHNKGQKTQLAFNDGLGPATDSTSVGMSSEQRLMYLSGQVDRLVKANLPQSVNGLQQEVAQLRGQLQDQERVIKKLQSQQQNLYQNVNAQIKQLQDQITSPNSTSNALNGVAKPPAVHPFTSASMQPTPQATGVVKKNDLQSYQLAFGQLMNKQYAKAEKGFDQYLQSYPRGKYASNVTYWLGELAFIKKHYAEAEAAFGKVINNYPRSNKIADAHYKLAVTHLRLGKTNMAKAELQAVEKRYAGKTVARLARLQLQQLM